MPGLDPLAVQRWRRVVPAESPWLHEEVAARMVQRLRWFRTPPASWLHWEPLTGGLKAHRLLREQLPESACFIEAAHVAPTQAATAEPGRRGWNPASWGRRTGPALAAADTRVAMLWANMQLHAEPWPEELIRRWHAHIDAQGFLMFSCLGPDTLRELREVYAQAGWPAPTHAFTDMHDWGDMLVHNGFAEPVMDMERITLSYSGAEPLLQELRVLGRNLNQARFPGWRARGWREQLARALERGLPRSDDGRLLLTFEVIYGHAFKAPPRVPLEARTEVSVNDMRAMLRAGRG